MSTNSDTYSKDELIQIVNNVLPARGEKCPKCGVNIPQFVDLSAKDEARLRRLICERPKDDGDTRAAVTDTVPNLMV